MRFIIGQYQLKVNFYQQNIKFSPLNLVQLSKFYLHSCFFSQFGLILRIERKPKSENWRVLICIKGPGSPSKQFDDVLVAFTIDFEKNFFSCVQTDFSKIAAPKIYFELGSWNFQHKLLSYRAFIWGHLNRENLKFFRGRRPPYYWDPFVRQLRRYRSLYENNFEKKYGYYVLFQRRAGSWNHTLLQSNLNWYLKSK